ncbi:MAG TPA: hypothetical protein VF791_20455 [Pyrinomonadaceae bacterium]
MRASVKRSSSKRLAVLGLILSLPPLYFVSAAALKYGFGWGLLFDPLAVFFADPLRLRILNLVITPLLFFGGLLAALALNLYAIFRLKARGDADVTLSSPDKRVHGWNVSVVVLSSLLLATITVYGILENFTHR